MRKISILLFAFLILTISASAFTSEKYVNFGGNKVFYRDTGKGSKAIVFIHGWTCSADFWDKSINAFPEYRAIALDLPGHGKSDKPKIDYTMEYFARAVEVVMKDAKVSKAVLVGHSMGTPVARQFYRLFPKKTLGIVIVDGSLRPGSKAQTEQFVSMLRANYKENSPKFVDGMLQPVRDETIKQQIRSTMLATPDYVGISAMEAMADEKIWTNDKINVPVLAIMAESPWWAPDTDTFFASIAPNLDFRMWQGVSHFLMMEKPEVFNKAVKLFIAKNNLL